MIFAFSDVGGEKSASDTLFMDFDVLDCKGFEALTSSLEWKNMDSHLSGSFIHEEL